MRKPGVSIGERFGRLVIIELRYGSNGSKARAMKPLCQCGCGNTTQVLVSNLRRDTISCGCAKAEMINGRRKPNRNASEYRIWGHMIQRCHNQNNPSYPGYGARGIFVDAEWRGEDGFDKFFAHIGKRPSSVHSVDRRDNNKGYIPGNVRWVVAADQSRNTRRNRYFEIDGESMTLKDWCARRNVPVGTVHGRLARGMSIRDALQFEREQR